MSKSKEKPGEVTVELDWLAETNVGVRMWDLNEVSKVLSAATAGGHRCPVTGIG